jgi:RHS repeat-associated protein
MLGYDKIADSQCNTRCTANRDEWCGGGWRSSIYEAAELPAAKAMCLRHDALGRLVLAGTTSPTTVTANGLACLTDAAVTQATARFKYDHRSRRVAAWKAETGEWVYTVFDQAGQPLAELALTSDPENPWRPLREYVWLDGKPLAQIEHDAVTGAARTYAVHTDAIGLPRALTSPTGVTVWSASPARPYGDITEVTTPDPETGKTVVTNLRLPGQYDERLLGSLGLQGPYYNWNRWYLPSAGRYLELDPIALAGGFNGFYGPNWYGYAEGNPLRYVDWDGLLPGSPYPTPDEAGACAINDINWQSIQTNLEYVGWVCRMPNGQYTYDAPHPVGPTGGNVPPPTCTGTVVGLYHTHAAYAPGYNNENFSSLDLSTLLNNSWDGYLGTPRGVIKKFNCTTVATKNLPYPKKNACK